MSSRKHSWAGVRIAHLAELTNLRGWHWGADPRTRRPCLLAPHGKVFDFRARPRIEIREHLVVNEVLI